MFDDKIKFIVIKTYFKNRGNIDATSRILNLSRKDVLTRLIDYGVVRLSETVRLTLHEYSKDEEDMMKAFKRVFKTMRVYCSHCEKEMEVKKYLATYRMDRRWDGLYFCSDYEAAIFDQKAKVEAQKTVVPQVKKSLSEIVERINTPFKRQFLAPKKEVEVYDDNISLVRPAKAEKKWRVCLAQTSKSCAKRVFGYKDNRQCVECKKVNARIEEI